MKITDFDIYKDLLKEKAGLSLTRDKSYLIISRLNPIAKKWGYDNLAIMTNTLRGVPPKDLVTDIVESMVNKETSFFRDKAPFNLVRDTILPYYVKNPNAKKHIRIWCMGSSTGQEAYSLAMLLKEHEAQMPGWVFSITATDISHEALELAKDGVYTQFECQRGLPVEFLTKYFVQNGNKWELHQDVKSCITFKRFNILNNMNNFGLFDVIFCRNILHSFDSKIQEKALSRVCNQLENDGFLFLGYDDPVYNDIEDMHPISSCQGVYAKRDGPHDSNL